MNSETEIAWPSFREQVRSILSQAWLASGTADPMPAFEDHDNLLEAGVADSFVFLELICALEETYGIDVEPTNPAGMLSVRGLYTRFSGAPD